MIVHENPAIRKNLPLTARDVRDLERLTGSLERKTALFALLDSEVPESDVSEAQMLHALVEAGLRAVEDRIEEASYAAEALERAAEEPALRAHAQRSRRRLLAALGEE